MIPFHCSEDETKNLECSYKILFYVVPGNETIKTGKNLLTFLISVSVKSDFLPEAFPDNHSYFLIICLSDEVMWYLVLLLLN